MKKENLITAVAEVGNVVNFIDNMGRENVILYYKAETDMFKVDTLIVSTSMHYNDSWMDYDYLMSIGDGFVEGVDSRYN